jgi:ribonuclease HII
MRAGAATVPWAASGSWSGIDEAGYGPNLGPLVMTRVTAEGREPDVWRDCAGTVRRAGGSGSDLRLRVDDSKRMLKGRTVAGRAELERTALAVVAEASGSVPEDFDRLIERVRTTPSHPTEIDRWVEGEGGISLPRWCARKELARTIEARPLVHEAWRIVSVRAAVIGPELFGKILAPIPEAERLKSLVHHFAFSTLMADAWREFLAGDRDLFVRSDKHGGRQYYLETLVPLFLGEWIDRGEETPTRSVYTVHRGARRLRIEIVPRADSSDALAALASIVSKYLRELWMDAFNGFWAGRVAGLRPTSGYPLDAWRFRGEIEAEAARLGLAERLWWREK